MTSGREEPMVRMRKLMFAALRRQRTLDEVKLGTTSLQPEREKEWVSGSQATRNEALVFLILSLESRRSSLSSTGVCGKLRHCSGCNT